MRKFLIKFAVFLLPLGAYIVYSAYELLVIPIDFFNFRCWEALIVYENNSILSGPFYPNYHLSKTELGDVAAWTKFSIPKEAEWFTDRYGYRKKEAGRDRHEIVIIGDSATAGSGLTQDKILSEVLEDELGVSVYPYASADINDFINEERFAENSPDIVIVESVEKLAPHLPAIIPESEREEKSLLEHYYQKLGLSDSMITRWAVLSDRLKKRTFINYMYARLAELPKALWRPVLRFLDQKRQAAQAQPQVPATTPNSKIETLGLNLGKDGKTVFTANSDPCFNNWEQIHIVGTVKVLNGYQSYLNQRGIKMIFLPIPNKENIYYELVEGGKKVENLSRLITEAKAQGIETIDTQTLFEESKRKHPDKVLFHLDDSHWNSYGVELAAEQLVLKLRDVNF